MTTTLSTAQLSELTNLTERRLRQLAEGGKLPTPEGGQWPGQETIRHLFSYYQQRGDEPEKLTQERMRLIKGQADLIEFKQRILNRDFVPVASVQAAWNYVCASLAARIKTAGLPPKLTKDLLDQCAETPLDYFDTNQPPIEQNEKPETH